MSAGVNCVLETIHNISMADKGTIGERISLPLWSFGAAAGIAWEAGKNFAAGSVIGDGIVSSIYHFASTVGTYTAGAFAAVGAIGLVYAVGKGPVITACEKLDEWLHIGEKMYQAEVDNLRESREILENRVDDVNRVSAQDINYDASSGEGNVLPTEDGSVSGPERPSPFSTTPRPK